MSNGRALIKSEEIQSRIQEIRGQKVIVDADLARFYGVETRHLNEQVSTEEMKRLYRHKGKIYRVHD